MSDLEYLYAVMVVFYLAECTHWIRTAAAPFIAWTGRCFRPSKPFFTAAGRDGGFHFASPLPTGGTFLVASAWPFALSPVAVVNPVGTMVCFDDAPEFTARRHRLMVGKLQLAALSSPAQARRLVALLNQLVATAQGEREEVITARMRAALDSAALSARLGSFRTVSRLPGILASVLLVFVFFLAPLVIWWLGVMMAWPWLLGGLVILSAVNSIGFLRAHRRLHPDLEDERFAHFLMVLLFPPAAMRTGDMLSRPLLEPFHPLAAASELCRPEEFEALACRVACGLRYPATRPASTTAGAGAVWGWHDRAMARAVEGLLVQHDLSLDQLVAPPAQADAGSRSYCPRCHAQFTRETGTCSDCGVGLASF